MAELKVTNAQIYYDTVIEAVRDVSFQVESGRIVTILGSNGAGKSTLLKAVSGILKPEKGALVAGAITLDGRDLSAASSPEIVRAGIVHVPEGRRLFINLTVEENLVMGGATRSRAERQQALERVYAVFPDLVDHRQRIAGYLSGGQQQMVAIGRALMSQPSLLMLDEPSLGLAPKIVEQIFQTLVRLRDEHGIGILLVEQNARLALSVADYGYVLERGRVVFDGTSQVLEGSREIQEFYLGMSSTETRRSMRDVKHYRRRKRWLS
ncbi:MAG: ABC transporter ATP-binding protein [Pseudomonadota bacterium]